MAREGCEALRKDCISCCCTSELYFYKMQQDSQASTVTWQPSPLGNPVGAEGQLSDVTLITNNPMLLWASAWPISNDLEILRVKVMSLMCIATAHDLDHRAEHDRQIEVEAPIVDIPYVELNTLLHRFDSRCLSAKSIDLRATSDARFHALPKSVICDDLVKVIVVNCRVWPRTDYGHLALDHIN